MTIRIGDNPEGRAGINKFIAKSGDGMRGKIVAIHDTGKYAIILSMNTSIAKDVEWGNLYLVAEKNLKEYPIVVERVSGIPDLPVWIIIGAGELLIEGPAGIELKNLLGV